ncbi:MAG TPA: phosphotransferase family protein [Dehalococcoidia bacterium]|nr:phosphotransferase family protein [Dehalococcoidia bacterium]
MRLPDDFTDALTAFLQRAAGAARVEIAALRRLTGGASRETWSLDATLTRADGSTETLLLVLQRDTRGAPKAMSRTVEFQLMKAAFDEGVPAPEPLFMGDGSLGGEFFLLRRVDGETLPRRLLREDAYATARAALPAQLGRTLAGIHAIRLEDHHLDSPLPAPPPSVSPARHEVDRYEQIYRAIALQPSPAFELAIRYLHRSPYVAAAADDRRTLVHGDFRIGNVLFGPEGLRLMLDWELAHIGDPMEDMGFICVRSWRFGGPKPVGGIGDRDEFFAAYEAAGGQQVDPERVRFWEVFGNLRWGVICLSQARTYIDGHSNSVELAAIGRRTAETEWELLELIG